MKLPRHKCGLTLEHNNHRNVYQTARKWWAEESERDPDNPPYDWESDEARERALATDEVWTLHWYPRTPIGFFCIAAPTLDELLAYALQVEDKENT